ncbi:Glyceraldehyde-3-phosphate dehydrogenase [Musa troglodytarum]|uniref:Glyceraldehyde-3-phosphate dehydrogenase n=1 Tax=Musa troglodytarum TaxID=320322 RepID=A0A9E7GP60_9LILI|nr:Glyceraldehyde-3-phosphate dehydrogenase [Musa troglodytarum]
MAFSTHLRSPTPALGGSRHRFLSDAGAPIPPSFKISCTQSAGNRSSIFGSSLPSVEAYSSQRSGARNNRPIKATATEAPPFVKSSPSGGRTKVGINGKFSCSL